MLYTACRRKRRKMAKVTKELIEQLIVEELESLSEEELNEINPFAGVGAGIKAATAGIRKQFKAGRAPAQAKALGKKYHKAMTKALNNLDALSKQMNAEFTEVGEKNPFVKELVKDFSPAFNKSLEGLKSKHAQLAQMAAGPAPEEEAAPAQDASTEPAADATEE